MYLNYTHGNSALALALLNSDLRPIWISEPGTLQGSQLLPQHLDLETALLEPQLLVFQACLLLSLALHLSFLALADVVELLLEALESQGQ